MSSGAEIAADAPVASPLRIAVLAPHDRLEAARAWLGANLDGSRVESEARFFGDRVRPGRGAGGCSPLGCLRWVRSFRPDVVLVLAPGAPPRWTSLLSHLGWRTACVDISTSASPDTGSGSPHTATLAERAARPGAGRRSGAGVSVVVTVLNELPNVDRIVRHVRAQLAPDDELILVDGGSTDGTRELLAGLPEQDGRIHVVDAPGTNIAAGRNAGIRASGNAVVACTDAGCAPVAGWLDALRAPFAETDPPVLVAGTCQIASTGPLSRAQAVACYPDPAEIRRPTLFSRTYGRLFGLVFDPTLPFARSLAFQRDPALAIGGFPEHLGWVEDGVFGREMARLGRCVASVEAEVEWEQRATLRSTARMYYQYGVGVAQSSEAQLRRRDALRLAAYALGPAVALAGGRKARAAVACGLGSYYSLPLWRATRRRVGLRATCLIPVAMGVKDVSKIAGTYIGGRRHANAERATRP